MKTTFIYSLSDPNTNQVRYIGKANDLKYRLWAHIHDAKHDRRNQHKCNWIKSLLREDKKPIIELIEEVDYDFWKTAEIYWISQFTSWGFDLINKTEGGECGIISESCKVALANSKNRGRKKGFIQSEETKQLIKAKRALQVITEETRKKISIRNKGKIISPETRQKMSIANKGKKRTKEQLERMKESKTKKIIEVYETGAIKHWESAEEIAEFYKCSVSSVRKKITKENYKSSFLINKLYYHEHRWNKKRKC